MFQAGGSILDQDLGRRRCTCRCVEHQHPHNSARQSRCIVPRYSAGLPGSELTYTDCTFSSILSFLRLYLLT